MNYNTLQNTLEELSLFNKVDDSAIPEIPEELPYLLIFTPGNTDAALRYTCADLLLQLSVVICEESAASIMFSLCEMLVPGLIVKNLARYGYDTTSPLVVHDPSDISFFVDEGGYPTELEYQFRYARGRIEDRLYLQDGAVKPRPDRYLIRDSSRQTGIMVAIYLHILYLCKAAGSVGPAQTLANFQKRAEALTNAVHLKLGPTILIPGYIHTKAKMTSEAIGHLTLVGQRHFRLRALACRSLINDRRNTKATDRRTLAGMVMKFIDSTGSTLLTAFEVQIIHKHPDLLHHPELEHELSSLQVLLKKTTDLCGEERYLWHILYPELIEPFAAAQFPLCYGVAFLLMKRDPMYADSWKGYKGGDLSKSKPALNKIALAIVDSELSKSTLQSVHVSYKPSIWANVFGAFVSATTQVPRTRRIQSSSSTPASSGSASGRPPTAGEYGF